MGSLFLYLICINILGGQMKVGIIGSTGYAGQQLVGLLCSHPLAEIKFVHSYSFVGKKYSEVYPTFKGIINLECIDTLEAMNSLDSIDVLFLALPHGKSHEIIKNIKNRSIIIIDLGADFRMHDRELMKVWYGIQHEDQPLLESFTYGLPEVNQAKIRKSTLIANPGCYPTASLLGLLPIIKTDYIDKHSIIIDAKSGVSGAGRKASLPLSYCETNENMKAYSIAEHRHTPEIEFVLSKEAKEDIKVSFTPHLIPMQRGILASIYIDLKAFVTIDDVISLYENYYKDNHFVRIIHDLPETKNVQRTNYCDISLRVDERTNRLIIVSVIDNLVKGSAGQAIQNMNLIFNLSENLGLQTNYFL